MDVYILSSMMILSIKIWWL